MDLVDRFKLEKLLATDAMAAFAFLSSKEHDEDQVRDVLETRLTKPLTTIHKESSFKLLYHWVRDRSLSLGVIGGGLTAGLAWLWRQRSRKYKDFVEKIDAEAAKHASKLADEIAKNTSDMIRKAKELEDFEQHKREVIYGRGRADRVAITETTAGISGGEYSAFDEVHLLGYGATRQWHTMYDKIVCKICKPLDQTDFDAWGELFPLGPPAHINCRCFIYWALLKPANKAPSFSKV